ncbi:MAG TPA: hypothetical protein VK541_09700 [Pedobacter sp.]|uniref:hypothetical protein n=1 Tax=Pedobacter sp. TaxID=1411316 RepID=UPI002C27B179|nr:hypothetical protein [Pedobacter sp.]HMI02744.1 hypothetical protein [Pedobacter sp.]
MIINRPFLLIFSAVLLSSCSSMYMPNVPNTPMLSQQGEFSGGAHISLRGNASLNGAYAVSNHFGVLFSGSMMNREWERKDYKNKLVEVGGGYFNTFGPDDNRILEVYVGYGGGSTDRTYRRYDDNDVLTGTDLEEATFNKTFLQVNYSSKKSNNLKLFGKDFPISYGTALRISSVEMKTFMINGVGQMREGNVFLEPIFFTRMKLSDQFQLQYTTSGNFGLNSRKYMNAGSSIFTIGAVVNLGGKVAKK